MWPMGQTGRYRATKKQGKNLSFLILHKLRRVFRKRIDHAAGKRVISVFIILSTLFIHGRLFFITGICGILTVKVAVGVDTGHILHGHGCGGLDAGVLYGCIERHTAPTADAEDPDARRVCIVLYGQKIHRSAEIFDVDVRGSTIPGLSAALAGKRRSKASVRKPYSAILCAYKPEDRSFTAPNRPLTAIAGSFPAASFGAYKSAASVMP